MSNDIQFSGLVHNSVNDTGYSNIFELIRANHDNAIKRVQMALDEAKKQDLILINPLLNNEEDIDKSWDRYMSFTKPFRRKSDWIALQYLGMDNQQIYDYLKRNMYEHATHTIMTDGNCGSSDDPLNFVENYVPVSQQIDSIDNALSTIDNIDHKMEIGNKYMRDTGYILLIPSNIPNLDMLEKYWDGYKTMVMRHQRMADWMTVELFGLTNEQIYIGMKKKFLQQGQDYIDDKNDPNSHIYATSGQIIESYFDTVIKKDDVSNRELAKSLINLSRENDYFERLSRDKIVSNAIDQYEGLTSNVPSNNWYCTDLPAYTPDELIDNGVFSSDLNPEGIAPNDDIVIGNVVNEKWFIEYCKYISTGVMTPEFRSLNLERVQTLKKMYKTPINKRDSIWKEQVKKLGWNPKTQYTESMQSAIDIYMRSILQLEYTDYYDFYDISDIEESENISIREMDFSNSPIKPIFIILFTGKNTFSKAIKWWTDSSFSHAMLSLDSSFKRCYSYGMEGAKSKLGGFIIEDLTNKPKQSLCKIYATFVSNEAYETIKRNIDWFIHMQEKTRYSFKNIVSFLFQIPMQSDLNMICSQFVDRMIKLGHIDFTKKQSALLSPADLDRAANRNKKIFTIYKGFAEKIKPSVIDKRIQSVYSKGKILEGADLSIYRHILECDDRAAKVYDTLIRPIDEIKELPIRFTKNGDVLVDSIKRLDYESEYQKAHKLLIAYEKENNIDGMKSELAHIWSFLIAIEEKLYGPKSVSNRQSLYKTRAKIIGDFKKYMQIVQRSDPEFDFGKYYSESPYSSETYRVSGYTINGLLKIVKNILY